jgi:hypothetical protein
MNVNGVQSIIQQLQRYLEHLDLLRLGHVNRLNS